MPTGMHVNRHARPTGILDWDIMSLVKVSPDELDRLENRLRAHVRQRMVKHGFGTTKVDELSGVDQSYIGRWLSKGRGSNGISAKKIYAILQGLGLDLFEAFTLNPPSEFWEPFVPRATGDPGPRRVSTAPAHPSRQTPRGGAR